jgi:ubiquinone biosynthesis protein UbiJ
MLLLAAGVLGLGDEAAAAAISRQLEPQAGHYAVVPPCAALAGPIELGLGCAQLTLGRTDAALRSFRSGAELAERLGDLPNELICRSGAAVAAVVLGADDGGTELSRSVAEGRRIGVPAIVERPGIASGILTAARRAGREDELQRAVAAAGVAPLRVPERPAKSRIQNAAENLRARGPDLLARVLGDAADEQLERRFGNRVSERALFTAMAKGFRPEEAHGFSGEIEYEVLRSDRRGASHWTLEVSGRRARALPRPSRRPAATIRLRLPTLIRLAAAVVNPTEAMLSGEIAISGDLELAGRLTGMFGGKLPEIATRGASVSGFAAATRA